MTSGQSTALCFVAFFLAAVALSGCTTMPVERSSGPNNANIQPAVTNQSEALNAQQTHSRKVEVTVSARVQKMLPDDTKGLPHERFLLHMDNGTTILVAHDTKLAPRVPLQEGDLVTVHGEYIWNERGGVIHWTHHAPSGRHEPGWIDFRGQRYD